MISVADLLVDTRPTGNYFASEVYVKGLLELGLLENRRGDRLLALPESLIRGLYVGLAQETGQAAQRVLFNCGWWWGKNFHTRFCEELTDYYRKPCENLSIAEFLRLLQVCWQTHGWGKISLDQTYQQAGFLIVETRYSPFTPHEPNKNQPVDFLECGILQSFFSQLSGQDLDCLQTTFEALGADRNRFILGLEKRLKPAKAMVEGARSHLEIIQTLVNPS